MNTINVLLDEMWDSYISYTPSAAKIAKLFDEEIVNDHIAFRTLNLETCNIHRQANYLSNFGYSIGGDYVFEQKKLNAIHLENENSNLPKIFLSELMLEKFSPELNDCFKKIFNSINVADKDLFMSGRSWDIDFEMYKKLSEESEYASWLYVWGFCPNHFTVSINHLSAYQEISEVNEMLKMNGFTLNSSGGEVKGNKKEMLEQSSIMADKVNVKFGVNEEKVPSCYYEFAKRYPDISGKTYQGFVTTSADKIFESTNK